MDSEWLPELHGARFEALVPDERALAELLPYRPELVDGRLHGSVVLRLRPPGSVVEYVEFSPRTSLAMGLCGTPLVLVARRERVLTNRMGIALSAISVVVLIGAFGLGAIGPTALLGWVGAAAALAAGMLAGWISLRMLRRRMADTSAWVALDPRVWGEALEWIDVFPSDDPLELVERVDSLSGFRKTNS